MAANAQTNSIPVLPDNHESLTEKTIHALSDADQVMPGIHTIISVVLERPNGLMKDQFASNLAKGLANLLAYFPLLGGVLSQGEQSRVDVERSNHEPIHLHIAHLDEDASVSSLESLIADHFIGFIPIGRLLPSDANVRGVRRDPGCPVSVFQASFIRGGVILTAAISHLVADAKTIDHAFAIWAAGSKAAWNNQPMPSCKLSFDRTYFNVPALPTKEELEQLIKQLRGFYPVPIAEFQGMKVADDPSMSLLEKTTADHTYHFSSSKIAALKRECQHFGADEVVSSLDVVLAATWRAMTRARQPLLKPGKDGKAPQTSMSFPVDARGRFEEVPESYVGNGFAMAVTEPLPVTSLLGPGGLREAALAIRHGVQSMKNSTVPDLMKTGAALMGRGERLKWNHDPNGIMSSDWTKMRVFTHYDFGFGLPIAVLRESPAGFSAAVTVTPPVRVGKADGVDILVTIEANVARALEEDEEFQQLAERQMRRSIKT